jgi:hypothetical protein
MPKHEPSPPPGTIEIMPISATDFRLRAPDGSTYIGYDRLTHEVPPYNMYRWLQEALEWAYAKGRESAAEEIRCEQLRQSRSCVHVENRLHEDRQATPSDRG